MPTREECIKIWDEYELPENIRDHIELVTKIAVFLGKELKKKGEKIDIKLVEKAALLHDIDKMQTVGENVHNHGLISHDILLEKGFSKELAELVKFHKLEAPNSIANRWEVKILRYSDARSLGDKIVSLGERFKYLCVYSVINQI